MTSYWISTLEQGLIFGIMVLGVYITYKILDFPDLSVDGTFPLGAAVTAVCLANDINPILSVLAATLVGGVAGYITGILHVNFRITNLLSGIIVMTGLHSVNLRIMGKSNMALFNYKNVFSYDLPSLTILGYDITNLLIIILATVIVKVLLDLYLATKSGFILRATGDNPQLVTSLGVDIGKSKIIGVSISNGLVALSGSLYAQYQGFSDVSMGVGIVVTGLASIIIGEAIFSRLNFGKATFGAIIGAIIYRYCIALALRAGLDAKDLKLVTAIIVIILLGLNNRSDLIKKIFRPFRGFGEKVSDLIKKALRPFAKIVGIGSDKSA